MNKQSLISVPAILLSLHLSPLALAQPAQVAAEPSFRSLMIIEPEPKSGFEIVPRFGINDLGGDQDAYYKPGAHLGLSLGARLSKRFSLHAEVSLDFLNAIAAEQFDSYLSAMGSVSVVPYIHLGNRDVELVFGPKLGVFIDLVEAQPFGASHITGIGNRTGLRRECGADVSGRLGRHAHRPHGHLAILLVQRVLPDPGRHAALPGDPRRLSPDPAERELRGVVLALVNGTCATE